LCGISRVEAAALNEEVDWKLRFGGDITGSVDVEVQTIFALIAGDDRLLVDGLARAYAIMAALYTLLAQSCNQRGEIGTYLSCHLQSIVWRHILRCRES
jgi:hypothetical protein